ncbi:MAG TPA: DUF4112 domain-containing protein [Chthoniobacteraceae bacterium]|jgi:hypothetical protein
MTKPAREIKVDEVIPSGQPTRLSPANDPLVAMIARLMDTAFVVPGTNIRFGLDALIGLIPGLGDTAGALVSTALILQSSRYGVPKIVLARMALNVLINTAAGSVPLLGDAFSVYFKSNARNYELLQRHSGPRRKSTSQDWLFVVGLIALMLLIVGLIIIGAVTLIGKLTGAAQ